MNKKEFDLAIKNIANSLFEEYEFELVNKIHEWKSQDNHPAVVNEPPVEKGLTVIDPKSDIQVSDENLPVYDSEWTPGTPTELGMAMKQLAEQIPESEMKWFYIKVRRLVDDAMDNVDAERMRPRLDDMEPELDR